jgi:hypothetical protein
MRQMAPMCGRIETEKLGPMISRSYQLLNMHRMLPEMPAEIRGQRLALTYTSPWPCPVGSQGSSFAWALSKT